VELQKLWNVIENSLIKQLNEQITAYENELQHIEKVKQWKERKQWIEDERDNKLKMIQKSLEEPNLQDYVWDEIQSIIKKQNETIIQTEPLPEKMDIDDQQTIPVDRNKEKQQNNQYSIEHVMK